MNQCEHRLTQLLREGYPLVGICHAYPAEGILETIGPGWDFVWIDGQHGQFSIESALRAVRCAAAIGAESVLRVPTNDAGLLAQYADTAASAIMVPQVDTAEIAAKVVRALRFPPAGNRSFGGRRAVDVHGRDYYRSHEPLVIAQIESKQAWENVEHIAAVEGIDVLFFGADDMKLSLGMPIEIPLGESDVLLRAQRETAAAARAAGKWCGTGIIEASSVPAMFETGYQMLVIGADVRFLRMGAKQALEDGQRAREKCVRNVSVNKS